MLSENGPAREVGKGFRGPEGPASGAVSVNWSHQRTKQLTKEVWVPYTQRRVPGGFIYSRSAQMSVSLQGQDADLAVVETQEGCEVLVYQDRVRSFDLLHASSNRSCIEIRIFPNLAAGMAICLDDILSKQDA